MTRTRAVSATTELRWLENADHWGEWERFDETTGERESIWMLKSKSSPRVRFYAKGKGQIGPEHASVVAATYWGYGTGYLQVCTYPMDIGLQIACRAEVLAGGAPRTVAS